MSEQTAQSENMQENDESQVAPVASSRLIGEILVDEGVLQSADLEKALQLQKSVGGRIGGLLVRTGAVSEDALLQALSQQLSYALLGFGENHLPDDIRVYEFLLESDIEFDWFLDQSIVLWKLDDETLGCLAKDPFDNLIRETLRYFYGDTTVKFFLCRNHDLDRLLNFVSRERAVESLFSGSDSEKQLKELAEEAPVIELVNNVISQAVDVGASDIHVEPSDDQFHVRLRVDGVLRHQLSQPIERFPAVASRIKLISGIDIAERRLPQDGRLTTRVSGQEMDIRVSTAPEVKGESIVMRLLPKERDDLSLANLGMEADHLALMKEWSQESNGIVLVTGPTGSGKSTTLYSMLDSANTGDKKMITVEDPVEFQLKGVTQIQARSDIGYTFATALRAILRQDPDVIMIGEIRDVETAEIAIQSALTGHLVLSTLHTNDAISAFTRLIDMGIEPFLVAAPLRAVQAQRLVRRVCQHCSEPMEPPADILESLQGIEVAEQPQWLTAKGCKACQNTGYKGRVGIYELVGVSADMQALVARNAPISEMREQAKQEGYRTLLQDGLLKARKGITTIEEVLRVVNH